MSSYKIFLGYCDEEINDFLHDNNVKPINISSHSVIEKDEWGNWYSYVEFVLIYEDTTPKWVKCKERIQGWINENNKKVRSR